MNGKLLKGQRHQNSSTVNTSRHSRHAPWLIAVLCAGTLMLGGCGLTAQPVVHHHHFTLGLSIPAAVNHNTAQQTSNKVLRIARINVPHWLTGTAMYYRLAYRKGSQLSAYAYSDWAAPPAAMLTTVIRRTFSASSHWQAVVGPNTPTSADTILRHAN